MTVLTADPPWAWDDKLPGLRGASAHLLPQNLAQVCATDLPVLERDSVLFLWRPASRLADALKVCEAWGFAPKTELVWLKTTPKGARHFGMGRIVRGEHETCLIATRGKPTVDSRSVRSTFSAPAVPYGKPPEFYALVRELYPQHTWYDRTSHEWSSGWQRMSAPKTGVVRVSARFQHT